MNIYKHSIGSVHNAWEFTWVKTLDNKWSHKLSGQTGHKQNQYRGWNGLYVYINQSQYSTLTWELSVSSWTYI